MIEGQETRRDCHLTLTTKNSYGKMWTMRMPERFHPRLLAVTVFSATYFVVAAVLGPVIVLVFDIGVTEPMSRGWPFASALFAIALIATITFAAAFAAGVFTPCCHARFQISRLRTLAILSALVALAAPLIAVLGLVLVGPLFGTWAPPASIQQLFCLLYIVAFGWALGHVTVRFS